MNVPSVVRRLPAGSREGRSYPLRTLFEQSELVRSPQGWRPSSSIRPDGASLVLGPFAETKGPRRSGAKPRPLKIKSHKNPQRTVNHSEQSGLWEGVWEYG